MEKESYKKLILIVGIILIGLICVWLGATFFKRDKMSDDELDILGKSLYAKTLSNYNDRYYFYGKDELTYEKMDNSIKLEAAMRIIPNTLYDINDFDSAYTDSCFNQREKNYTCISKKVNKDIFERYYRELFGSDKNIEYKEFKYLESNYEECNLENDSIVCYPFTGGDIRGTSSYFTYDSAKQVKDTLEVYVKHLGQSYEDNSIYSDYGLTKKIGSEERLLNKDEIFEKYADQAGEYILQFEKDKVGNWYWIKTSMVVKTF